MTADRSGERRELPRRGLLLERQLRPQPALPLQASLESLTAERNVAAVLPAAADVAVVPTTVPLAAPPLTPVPSVPPAGLMV